MKRIGMISFGITNSAASLIRLFLIRIILSKVLHYNDRTSPNLTELRNDRKISYSYRWFFSAAGDRTGFGNEFLLRSGFQSGVFRDKRHRTVLKDEAGDAGHSFFSAFGEDIAFVAQAEEFLELANVGADVNVFISVFALDLRLNIRAIRA